MFVFSRRKNESVVINDDITLTVMDIRGDKVRLGIVCPKEVPVHRQEVFDAVHGRMHPQPPPRPPEERPFLQAILAEPDDEGTRLVFADWLEERDDPLGEFLRNVCRLAKSAPGLRRGELERRQRFLWAEHGAAWGTSLPRALWSFPSGGLPQGPGG
jgi:carbon storage regulator